MRLEHDKIIIRNATADDATQLCRWWNDGAVMAHAGFPNGLHTTEERIVSQIADDSDETRRRHMILFDGMPIGEMSYYNLGNGVCEIGIKICDTSHQNQGLGKIILSMFIGALFNEFGYQKIVLDTNLKNKRAQHVYEQLGFQKIRINYDSWTDQLGEMQSSVDYELTKDTFRSYL